MSQFQWVNTFFGLCCNWNLFNKKDTLSTGNFSITNGDLLMSCGRKLGRRKWKNDHYLLKCKEYIRNTSSDASASKTFYQHWCISWLYGDYSIEWSFHEGKLEKTGCWERSSIREKLRAVGEMHEQKLLYWKVVAKVSNEIFLKVVGVFFRQQ